MCIRVRVDYYLPRLSAYFQNMPDSLSARPPLIIAGMHRSGTTLVARLLASLGVFLGWRTERNGEARTFLEINKWLLLQAGGAWDFPPPAERFAEPRARELCLRFMRYALNSVWFSFYLGRPHLRPGAPPPRYPDPWGWKDPRNTITLPLWAELYPDAPVVYVVRHGVDVAASLLERRARRLDRISRRFALGRHAYWLRLRKRRIETGPGSLDQGLALWQRYQELAEAASHCYPETFLQLRYEDLLADPVASLRRLVRHVGIEPGEASLRAAARSVRPERAFAYRDDPELAACAARHASLLARYGYGETAGVSASETQ